MPATGMVGITESVPVADAGYQAHIAELKEDNKKEDNK